MSWKRGLAIGVYLLSHGALFLNFMTLNPKLAWLVLAALLAWVLRWADPPKASTRC